VLESGTDEIDCFMFKKIATHAELPELANDIIFGIFDQDGNGEGAVCVVFCYWL
jgi:hypothetical protein